jgi:hypothetical protein
MTVGGRDHISHRLVRLGLNDRQAVLLLWLLSALVGAAALLVHRGAHPMSFGLLPLVLGAQLLVGIYLAGVDVRVAGTPVAPGCRAAPATPPVADLQTREMSASSASGSNGFVR